MLVEDEEDIRVVAKFALEQIGQFNVKYCTTGKEALQTAEAFSPDLILMDMMMPDMDGIMTLKALKAIPTLSIIPVVFMTAKVQNKEVENYISAGAIGVIPKPFNPLLLPETLNQIWLDYQSEVHDPVSETDDNEFADEFKNVCNKYRKNLPNKIREIETVFNQLCTTWNAENLTQFTLLVHKLYGSAGIYGYKNISEQFKQIEQYTVSFTANKIADQAQMDTIQNIILEIKKLIDSQE